MNKINFEDATLVNQAKVTINGTDYEVTPATYSGGTDLDADTLNYAFSLMHPVGSIYMTTVATNPHDIFGFGTWVAWGSGRVPVGINTNETEFNTVEKTGGEKTHTLTIDEMPSHNHYAYCADSTGSSYNVAISNSGSNKQYDGYIGNVISSTTDQPHNNLQPYITCYMWKRTA